MVHLVLILVLFIQAISKTVPSFFGGSADLAGSNKSNVNDATDYSSETPEGKNVWFCVREFAMGATVMVWLHMEVYIHMVQHSSYLVII